ncbi:hypothetical protein FRC12_008673 [Ceratobasidium sp. 428]|nr:hypothetical protein FRC12_008673 [Ceratobasidium sp. 428]
MPPKRTNPSGEVSERPAKKAATGSKKASTGTKKASTGGKKTAAGVKKASTPQLQASTQPKWDKPEYSDEKPTGEWAKMSVERWCLLPPYNTLITDDQWKTYYHERSGLDDVNSVESDKNRMVISDELCCDTWEQLRFMSGNVAAAIFGSVLDDEHKKRIGRTLLGSLYLIELSGSGEGDGSPREIRAMTRLYSPFGLGTSIDFHYGYYVRIRYGDRFGSLGVIASTISDCDAEMPRKSRTIEKGYRGSEKAARGVTTVFNRVFIRPFAASSEVNIFLPQGEKSSRVTNVAKIKEFEEPLFGCTGWLSPLKLTHLLFAAAGVMSFNEDDTDAPKSALAKFQFFQGENDGKDLLKQELEKLGQLEDELDEDMDCVPERLLLLAQQEIEVRADTNAKAAKGNKKSKKV